MLVINKKSFNLKNPGTLIYAVLEISVGSKSIPFSITSRIVLLNSLIRVFANTSGTLALSVTWLTKICLALNGTLSQI